MECLFFFFTYLLTFLTPWLNVVLQKRDNWRSYTGNIILACLTSENSGVQKLWRPLGCLHDRAVADGAVCSPMLGTELMPGQAFLGQTEFLLVNNSSQINLSAALSAYTGEFDSTVMLILRVWERRWNYILMWNICCTVLVEVAAGTMFWCEPKSAV